MKAYESWLETSKSPWRIGWGVVSAILTLSSIASYFREKHHPGSAWYLLLAAGFLVLWLGSEVVRWRIKHFRVSAQLAASEVHGKSVSKRHLRDLKATAAMLSRTVSSGGNGDYGTRPENLALKGHFPELYEQFTQWKLQTTLRSLHPKFLFLRIDVEMERQGVAYPVLKVANFAEYMGRAIQHRAEQGLPWDYEFDFHWNTLENGDVEIPAFGAVIDAAAAQAKGMTTEQCESIIETVFKSQSEWMAGKLNEIDAKLKEVTPGLVTRLDVIASMYEVTGECPSCNQALLAQVGDDF